MKIYLHETKTKISKLPLSVQALPKSHPPFTMAPTNKAAFYPSDKASSLVIDESPYPVVGEDEIIVKVAAAAINPVDAKIQQMGTDIFPFLTYPLTGGLDISGTVVQTGPKITNFHPGDRILSFPFEFASRSGGFQHYVAVPALLSSHIPTTTSLLEASVLPSCLSTAAVALHHYLGLETPTSPARPRNGQTVLVAGGASAVGSNAIQLAVAAGYEVLATSSRASFAHCEALGASRVFDYRDAHLAQGLKAGLKGKKFAGAVSCVEESNDVVFDVVSASASASEREGSKKKVACTILFAGPERLPAGVEAEMVHAYWIKDTPLAEAIFGTFLPAALASGEYKCEPKPRVVGKGLESVQAALDIIKTNAVSCEKLIVTLDDEA